MNILFWNLNKNKLKRSIYNVVQTHNIDVIILAESQYKSSEILLELNKKSVEFFPQHPLSQCEKVQIITRFHYRFAPPVFETNRYTIRKVSLPGKIEFLLTAVHFIDKHSHKSESQSETASIMNSQIEKIENDHNLHSNILVGDLNMNPFEKGIIKANGFQATMSGTIAKTKSRIVQGIEYKYFYNPMWSLYGDLMDEPIGTYYYRKAELINYQWNIFDQVLLRPDLIDRFAKNKLKILKSDGKKDLIDSRGHPKKGEYYSDHLPIIFTIDLTL